MVYGDEMKKDKSIPVLTNGDITITMKESKKMELDIAIEKAAKHLKKKYGDNWHKVFLSD